MSWNWVGGFTPQNTPHDRFKLTHHTYTRTSLHTQPNVTPNPWYDRERLKAWPKALFIIPPPPEYPLLRGCQVVNCCHWCQYLLPRYGDSNAWGTSDVFDHPAPCGHPLPGLQGQKIQAARDRCPGDGGSVSRVLVDFFLTARGDCANFCETVGSGAWCGFFVS